MKAFYRVLPAGADDNQRDQEIKLAFERLGVPAISKLLPRRAIATSTTRIAHGLGSVPTGWRVFNLEGDARVWESAIADDRNLYLQASVAVTAGIEVF